MDSPSTVNSLKLLFTSGGRTSMSMSRQALTWARILSVLDTSEVMMAAMNSAG